MTKERTVKDAQDAFIAALDAGAEQDLLMDSILRAVGEDRAERKKWTEIEIEFLRRISNRDFEKWLKDHQDKLQPVTQS